MIFYQKEKAHPEILQHHTARKQHQRFATRQPFSREDNGSPLQYSCMENPMDGGPWWAAVHGVGTERLHFHFSLSCIGEGNGNPLQCSCLENPRDGGAWWAAFYGVAESRTRLKRLSGSSSLVTSRAPPRPPTIALPCPCWAEASHIKVYPLKIICVITTN